MKNLFQIDVFLNSERGKEIKKAIEEMLPSLENHKKKIGRCDSEGCYSCVYESVVQCPETVNTFRLQWTNNSLSSSSLEDVDEFLHSLKSFDDVDDLERALKTHKSMQVFTLYNFI